MLVSNNVDNICLIIHWKYLLCIDLKLNMVVCKTATINQVIHILNLRPFSKRYKIRIKTLIYILHSVVRDGASLCGVFCAVYNAIQQLTMDDEVDVFSVVRQLQIRRPELCSSLVNTIFIC